ncbi:MAG TPA: DegT/DnrJ/EryC1/StrS family aminotransferase [Terriglobales bacterium]|jgi:dTDP-4-amino-4,6-dideoxygalactose transaminase|nr:DegT/DnrJ/EryC1/StrS family aminotransferase [Terriglobales bacterium]
MKINRYDYRSQFERFEDFMAEMSAMMLDGRYVLSEEVSEFERAFAAYLQCSFVVGVNTGTDALLCSLKSLALRPEHEVVTHANTFNATVAAICLAGLKPLLVDADEDSFLMDIGQAIGAMTSQTQVLLPVHLYGKPTPMHDLIRESEKRGIYVVEDAAQAHGARLDGRRMGTFGTLGCFSFHPSKNLAAAGDGGAIATNRADLKEQLSMLRSLGQAGQNDHLHAGYNTKLDSIQAKVLSWKLPSLDQWNEQRRKIARQYHERLSGLPLKFQNWNEGEEHVFHLFGIRSEKRDELLSHLQSRGVDAVIRYPVPIHLQPAFSQYGWRKGQFPVAEALARELLCLPLRPNLSTTEVDYVADSVRSFFKGNPSIHS